MTLAEIIRKGDIRRSATATSATAATEKVRVPLSVAKLATVAMVASKIPPNDAESFPNLEPGCIDITVEPASAMARSIYWEAMDGTWHGPVKPEYLGRTGSREAERFWVVVTCRGKMWWIRTDQLRSKNEFMHRQQQ
jgi:hypothetical protein